MSTLRLARRLGLAAMACAMCLAKPAASGTPSPAATVPSKTSKPALVLLIGGPSELLAPRSFFGESKPACATFVLMTAKAVESIQLVTTGLGDARLTTGRNCPKINGASTLDLTKPPRFQAITVGVFPDRKAGDYKGKIQILSEGEVLANADFSVLQPADSTLVTALKWAFGLITPTVAAFFLTRSALRRDNRRKESEEFRRIRSDKYTEIAAALEPVRTDLEAKGISNRGPRVWKTLSEKGVLQGLPKGDEKKLIKACEASHEGGIGNVAKIRAVLIGIFPAHKKAILRSAG